MQETTFPFEIIFHEDASVDSTKDILQRYSRKYPDIIKLILQPTNTYSKGSAPLLRSLLDVKGEFVAICDGDDYWLDTEKLQKQVEVLDVNKNCTIVSHKVRVESNVINARAYSPYVSFNAEKYDFRDVIKGHFIPTLSILFRKSALGISDPYCLKNIVSRDIAIELMLLKSGYGIHLDERMGVYRHHDSGMTKKKQSCNEGFNQMGSMLDFVAQWVGDDFSKEIHLKRIRISLKKELCLLKRGNVSSSVRLGYLFVTHPIITFGYFIYIIKYKFFNSE